MVEHHVWVDERFKHAWHCLICPCGWNKDQDSLDTHNLCELGFDRKTAISRLMELKILGYNILGAEGLV